MIRRTLASIAATMLIAATPLSAQTSAPTSNSTMSGSSAQTMNCKDQMAKAEPMMNSMTDKTKKESAMNEMTMAKEMMGKNDEKGCMAHMEKGMGIMKGMGMMN